MEEPPKDGRGRQKGASSVRITRDIDGLLRPAQSPSSRRDPLAHGEGRFASVDADRGVLIRNLCLGKVKFDLLVSIKQVESIELRWLVHNRIKLPAVLTCASVDRTQ